MLPCIVWSWLRRPKFVFRLAFLFFESLFLFFFLSNWQTFDTSHHMVFEWTFSMAKYFATNLYTLTTLLFTRELYPQTNTFSVVLYGHIYFKMLWLKQNEKLAPYWSENWWKPPVWLFNEFSSQQERFLKLTKKIYYRPQVIWPQVVCTSCCFRLSEDNVGNLSLLWLVSLTNYQRQWCRKQAHSRSVSIIWDFYSHLGYLPEIVLFLSEKECFHQFYRQCTEYKKDPNAYRACCIQCIVNRWRWFHFTFDRKAFFFNSK